MTTKKDGGPAYPQMEHFSRKEEGHETDVLAPIGGMTMRQYYAAHAPDVPDWYDHCSDKEPPFLENGRIRFFSWRWYYADMMIKTEEE